MSSFGAGLSQGSHCPTKCGNEATNMKTKTGEIDFKNAGYISCFYTNANSLRNKKSELEPRINKLKPHLVAITEVWQKEYFGLPDYHPAFRKDRPDGQSGGGVMLLVHGSINVLDCPEMNSHEFEESVWCILCPSKNERVLVGVCYRSPNSSAENNRGLHQLLEKAMAMQADSVLVMGDFNYRQIDWRAGTVDGPDDSDPVNFYHATNDLFLYQHVSAPTRFREGCSPSTIDLIFTKEEHEVDDLTIEDPLGKSDHAVLVWKHALKTKRNDGQPCQQSYNFKRGRYSDMIEDLGQEDWNVMHAMSIEEAWIHFKGILAKCIENHVPKTKSRRTTATVPWWSKELKKQVKLKHSCWKTYVASRLPEDFAKYRRQRNKTTQQIRRARRDYEEKLIGTIKTDSKKFHKYIRTQQKVKVKVTNLETDTGGLTSCDSEAAEVLQKCFQSVFLRETDGELPDFAQQVDDGVTLSEVEFTVQDVLDEMQTLRPDKAAGPDGIPPTVLKICARQLASPLHILFIKSLNEQKLPNDWKVARVTAIFKKGARKKPGNYRPISLTSQVCKLLERLVRKQLVKYRVGQKEVHRDYRLVRLNGT